MRAWLVMLVSALLLCVGPSSAWATSDFEIQWHTLETPHFLVHYHDGLEQLALDSARIAEESHYVLAPLLDWEPGARTHIVISDFGDGANGSARILPYNLINLLAASPDIRGTLNDYDNWLRGLIYHEYVHILHIDTITGFAAVLNTVFGKVAAPNGTLPRWYSEGLATYYESQRTSAGRVRNSLFDMFLRTQALGPGLFSLGAITGAPVRHPGVTAWYLHGSHFVSYIAAKHGERALTEFNHEYGDRFIPYGLNIVARDVFDGEDLPTMYAEWQTAVEAEGLAQWVTVQALGGTTPYEVVSSPTLGHDQLRKRPGHNQLSYARSDGESSPSIVLYDLDTAEETVLVEQFGSGRHSWSPDGDWFVTGESVIFKRVYRFGDLYRYEVDSGAETRLTTGLRAREPAVSTDGRSVAFVTLRQGTTDLCVLDLATQDVTVLATGEGIDHFASPAWFPDGKTLVVSRFHGADSGQRDLFLFDIETSVWTAITDDKAMDFEPTVSADGRWVVFSSDRTGIFNLYAHDTRDGSMHQLTRAITGFFNPAFLPDSDVLLATVYGPDGYDVAQLSFQAQLDDNLQDAPRSNRQADIIEYTNPSIDIVEKDYRPWRYMWPRTWLPQFVTTLQFEGLFTLTVGGSDPVGQHGWLASVAWDADASDLTMALSYVYRRLPFDLQIRLARNLVTRQYRSSEAREPYVENQMVGAVDVVVPFAGKDDIHTLTASYSVVHFDAEDPLDPPRDPVGLMPAFPELGFFSNLLLSWRYSSVERYANSISSELGFVTSIALRLRAPLLGADVNSVDVSWTFTAYLPIPFLSNHVLATRYAGGVGWADYNRRGLFVVGGLPEQDIVQALLNGFGVPGALLRGYPLVAGWGNQFHQINTEYRLPIWRPEWGYDTFPLYIGELWAAVFADAGTAYFGDFDLEEVKVGVGAELRLTTLIGYFLPGLLRLGYGYGIHEGGFHHIYLVLGSQF